MKDLTKEATKQAILDATRLKIYKRTVKRRKTVIDETSLLKGRFEDYLTDIDITSPCERLPDDYQNHLDKWWNDLNEDMESDNPPF